MLPRIALGNFPTPLEQATALGDRIGVNLIFKREDLSGFALGGNRAPSRKRRQGGVKRRCILTMVGAPSKGLERDGSTGAFPQGEMYLTCTSRLHVTKRPTASLTRRSYPMFRPQGAKPVAPMFMGRVAIRAAPCGGGRVRSRRMRSGSALDRSGEHTSGKVPLQEGVDDDDWNGRANDDRHLQRLRHQRLPGFAAAQERAALSRRRPPALRAGSEPRRTGDARVLRAQAEGHRHRACDR